MRLETAMRFGASFTGGRTLPMDYRPDDDELDLFGLTHPGRVRAENQDHFLLCTVHPQVVVHGTSLPDPGELALRGGRLATLVLVADGVGGGVAGSRASRLAIEAVTRYLATSLRRFHTAGTDDEGEFMADLLSAAMGAHETVRADADAQRVGGSMATTLSLGVVVWPWIYVLQVGDSRCYYFENGRLRQVTRDQTLAQDLVDRGLLSRERARESPLNHVLSSAIGASEAAPEITRVDVRQRGAVLMFCTDGLTKHVSDDEIAAHLAALTSSEQACRALVELALARGGTDNVTVAVARVERRAGR